MTKRIDVDGEVVRELREDIGISRENLADIARISGSVIRRLETGESSTAAPLIIERLAIALGCRPQDLSSQYTPPPPTLLGRVHYNQQFLKEELQRQGYTFEQFADLAGFSVATAHSLVHRTRPSANADTVYKAARALDLDPGALSEILASPPPIHEREMAAYYGWPGEDYYRQDPDRVED